MWRSTSLFSTSTISSSPVVIFLRTRTIQVSGRLLKRWNRCPGTFRPRFSRNPRFITFDCKLRFQHFAVLSFFPISLKPHPHPCTRFVLQSNGLSARSSGNLGRYCIPPPLQSFRCSAYCVELLHLTFNCCCCCLSLNPSTRNFNFGCIAYCLQNCKFYCQKLF